VEEAKKGRIRVVDGQYLMADAFLPGGEAFVREILYGKKYVKEKLGLDVKVGWITDSFGLNAQIPQIYRDAGYKWLAFGRGLERKPRRSEFWWKGLDGTKILAHYFSSTHSYHVGLFAEYLKENIEELKTYATTKNILMPCGIGSCPFPERVLKAIEDFNRENPNHEIVMALPEDFFQAVEKEADKLEILEGEMYGGERVFDGVWSTRMWVKLEYFKVKNLVLNTEKFATIAWLLGKPYPKQRLREAWEKILFIAFHDTVTGTSIDEVFEEVKEHFRWLEENLTLTLEESLRYIVSKIDFDEEAIIVFNPNSFRVKSYVEKDLEFGLNEKVENVAVENVDYEIIEEDRDNNGCLRKVKIGFIVEIPPLGYKVCRILRNQAANRAGGRRRVYGKSFIGNSYVNVRVNPLDGKSRIFNREGYEVVKEFRLELENEVGSVYSHRDISKDLVGVIGAEGDTSPNKPLFRVEDFKIEESNICQKAKFKEEVYGCFWPYRLREHYGVEFYRQKLMDIEKEITVFKDIPWVEVKVKLRSSFPHVRFRANFNVNFEGEYFANTAFGVVKRRCENRDFPMEDWIEYGNKQLGITIFTKGIPGHQINKNHIYLTLLRSVNLISHGDKGPITPVQDALELEKDYEFKFALYPHHGDWKENEVWIKALTFTNPPIPVYHDGKTKEKTKPLLPSREFSFLSLPKNVILSCLKQSEDGESVILRFYETSGENTSFKLNFFKKPDKILISNIMEEKEKEASEEVKLRPFQILTLKLKL
jgi:alpha-mannosidase